MSTIKSTEDAIRETISSLSQRAVNKFQSAIISIYGSTDNGAPDHIGSCIALDLQDQKLLLTAAHVVDCNDYTTLYLGTTKLMPLEMNFFSSGKPHGDRDGDHYDFAVGRLSSEMADALDGVGFISECDICLSNWEPQGTIFTIAGYPNSKNTKVDHAQKKVIGSLFCYSNSAITNRTLMEKLDISAQSHIILQFDQKRSKNQYGKQVNSVRLKGISGGPAFNLGRLTNPMVLAGQHFPKPCLAGMVIEYHARHKAVIVTRLNIIRGVVGKLL